MLKVKLRKLNKIAKFLKKTPRFLAERAFLASLVFIFLAVILGVLVFYKYSFLAEKREPEIPEESLFFDEKTFKEILRIRQERQERFQNAAPKEHLNPFRASGLTETANLDIIEE